jgi:ATP-binding cassette, subfamily B, bacterial PglK
MIKELKKLVSLFSSKDRLIILVLFANMFIGAFLEIIGISAVPVFISLVAFPDKVAQYPAVKFLLDNLQLDGTKELLVVGSVALIGLIIVKNGFLVLNVAFQAWFTKSRMVILATRLFSAYMSAPYHFHLERNSAELLRNVQTEVSKVANSLVTILLQLSTQVIFTISVLIFLYAIEPLITFASFGFFLFFGVVFLSSTQRKIREYGGILQDHNKITIQSIQQGLGSLKEARVLNREKYFIDGFTKSTKQRSFAQRFRQIISKLPSTIMEVMAVSGMLLLTSYLVFSGRPVQSVVTTLALFAVALSRLRGSIGGIVNSYLSLRYSIISVNPVYDDLHLLNKLQSSNKGKLDASSKKARALEKSIEVEKVSFRYPGTDIDSLADINISVNRGSTVGFVGSTGSGKTTLVDIILGLLEPGEGQVKVDGKNIQEDLSGWQKNIGYIPQTIYLLDDSIRNNIALGIESQTIEDDRIRQAMDAAQITEFVQRLPDGEHTVIGEQGVRLSGGQRQRIGIARAIYHDPDILIMDEATSSLDNATEQYVMRAIEEMKGKRTILMIAHRLTTVENCDVLYFLKNGRIESSGTYAELQAANIDFSNMTQSA